MSYPIDLDPTLPERELILSLAGQLHDFRTFLGGGQDGSDKATMLASLSRELDEQQRAKTATSETDADSK
jgi:hypothetical protein